MYMDMYEMSMKRSRCAYTYRYVDIYVCLCTYIYVSIFVCMKVYIGPAEGGAEAREGTGYVEVGTGCVSGGAQVRLQTPPQDGREKARASSLISTGTGTPGEVGSPSPAALARRRRFPSGLEPSGARDGSEWGGHGARRAKEAT